MTDYTNEQISKAVAIAAAIIQKYPTLESRTRKALGLIRGRSVDLDAMTVKGSNSKPYSITWAGDSLDCNCFDMANFQAPVILDEKGQPIMMCKHVIAVRIAAKVTGRKLEPPTAVATFPTAAAGHHTIFADGTAVPNELLREHMTYMLTKGKQAQNQEALTAYIYQ